MDKITLNQVKKTERETNFFAGIIATMFIILVIFVLSLALNS